MSKSMKHTMKLALAAGIAMTMAACDWSGGGGDNNFNTSGGAFLNNISGFYRGLLGGGRVVSNTSAGNITSLTIQQGGNAVTVTDNQGSTYNGSVGSPLSMLNPGQGQITSGQLVSTLQVSWSGKDEISGLDIEFTGTINLVAITDIDSQSETRTTTTATNDSNQSDTTTTTTQTDSLTTTQQQGVDGIEPATTRTTTTETTDTSGNGDDVQGTVTVTTINTFAIDESNTQLRLRGTWVEQGGRVSTVDAVAAGVSIPATSVTTTTN